MLPKTSKFNYAPGAIFVALFLALLNFGIARRAQASELPSAPFVLHAIDQDYAIDTKTLKQWQTPTQGSSSYISFQPERNADSYVLGQLGLKKSTIMHVDLNNYNVSSIYDYLKNIEPEINHSSEDAVFKTAAGRVTDFNPGQNGADLDIKTSIDTIVSAIGSGQTQATLAINETKANVNLADTNNLGIKELVGVGESNFSGSPNNRIFNIRVGVSKEAGTIVAPGGIFSFNDNLGLVDGDHGFLPELVIKKEGTIPEFG